MTKYEKCIYDMISESENHLTAEQVFIRMKEIYPSVVLATVYNNINRLLREGKIRRISMEGAPDRYDRIARHDHLICKKCGRLTDVHFDDLTESLKKQLGDEVFFYDLKVVYICPDCRKKERDQQDQQD